MIQHKQRIYQDIIRAADDSSIIDQVILGLTWTGCRVGANIGFAQSPGIPSRILSFPGTLAGRHVSEVASWVQSWNPFEATVGLAAANASINSRNNPLMHKAQMLESKGPANLAVFEYFRPRLAGKKVVIIGRYPALDEQLEGLDVKVLERQPGKDDLPDPAAEYLLPEADWVFLTATSLINKTFPRLAELSRDAVTILMGPSTPWLESFAGYGVNFLAGTLPIDPDRAMQIAAEGGGTRLFGEGVRYAVLEIG